MPRSASELLKGYGEIASLPTIFTRINEAVNNPHVAMKEISCIISEDPRLAERLLMFVNSALYFFPTRVESIARAVAIVGAQQLRDLALATYVMSMFKGIPEDLVNIGTFWKHSITCGIAARTLATYRREVNVERFFVCGLLHDIGRLVMFVKLPDESREALLLAKRTGQLLYVCEHEILGFDHASVGKVLLQAWKLSSSEEEAVGCHHAPTSATRFPVETAIVHIADIVAHSMQREGSGDHGVPPLSKEAWERVGLPIGVLRPAIDRVDSQLVDAERTLL